MIGRVRGCREVTRLDGEREKLRGDGGREGGRGGEREEGKERRYWWQYFWKSICEPRSMCVF